MQLRTVSHYLCQIKVCIYQNLSACIQLKNAETSCNQSVWAKAGYARHQWDILPTEAAPGGDAAPLQLTVVAPRVAAKGRPWAWHGEFFGHRPEPDIALLGQGFHLVYLSVPPVQSMFPFFCL
jgi:hypothetical protein